MHECGLHLRLCIASLGVEQSQLHLKINSMPHAISIATSFVHFKKVRQPQYVNRSADGPAQHLKHHQPMRIRGNVAAAVCLVLLYVLLKLITGQGRPACGSGNLPSRKCGALCAISLPMHMLLCGACRCWRSF
jgi:hypothetical protein